MRLTLLSTGPSADGLGLGLAIVHEIATAHDATVNAEARTGGLRIAIASQPPRG